MAGRRPSNKPRILRTGNEVNSDVPTAPEGAPAKPTDLSPVAAEEWDKLVSELTDLGIISECDRAAIEMAARYAAHYYEADADVRKHGLLVETKTGTKANPSIRARDDAARIRNSYLQQLGLTPASRSRVSMVPTSPERDELDELLDGN